jgi:REP element-mobilizing transposase RayT
VATKKQIQESEGVYFITITCHAWLPLIELTQGYDIVYKWFDYLKSNGHYITGYVIMPNHIHVLIAFTKTDTSINTMIGNGKRFIVYEIVKRLQEKGNAEIISQLTEGVSSRDFKRGKLHEVFEPSFDWKECRSNRFINQKLDYIHDNPCRGKWNLSDSPVEYEHSSAKFYLLGKQGIYEVFHCGLLEDVDLTNAINNKV